MKTSAQFKAWVEGLRWQHDLWKSEFGTEPETAGELLHWVHKHYAEFLRDNNKNAFHRYTAGTKDEDRFRAWMEARVAIKQAIV